VINLSSGAKEGEVRLADIILGSNELKLSLVRDEGGRAREGEVRLTDIVLGKEYIQTILNLFDSISCDIKLCGLFNIIHAQFKENHKGSFLSANKPNFRKKNSAKKQSQAGDGAADADAPEAGAAPADAPADAPAAA
jgi:hypothetical protein